ncbi:MAG: DNA (cytosine-5)-methyltransferase 1 [Halopseudomonas sp.]
MKGIPEEVIAGESDTVAHEILGQSVIYPVFEAIGLELGVVLTSAVEPSIISLRSEGITSYCQQICGGNDCGPGLNCNEGINSLTEMPGINAEKPFQEDIFAVNAA